MATFSDLAVGQTFDWIDDERRGGVSFFQPCKKISARKYIAITSGPCGHAGHTYQVGTLNARVFHVDKYKEHATT